MAATLLANIANSPGQGGKRLLEIRTARGPQPNECMKRVFSGLVITGIAVHEVLRRNEDLAPVPPRCSDALAELEPQGMEALRQRVATALGSDSKSVEMEIIDRGRDSVFGLCARAIVADDVGFLSISKDVAQKLAEAQSPRSIPGGVLVVFRGRVESGNHFCGVVKAELQTGFVREDSEHGPLMRFLTDLLLTPHQKLYKIGMYVCTGTLQEEPEDMVDEEFTAFVYDSYITGAEITTAANYFYERFMGCRAASSARKLTKDFWRGTTDFIEDSAFASDKKVELASALNVYLRSNRGTILLREFAEENLPDAQVQGFVDYMVDRGLPDHAIQKDIETIRSKLRIRRVTFTGDVRLTAPAGEFDRRVTIDGTDEDGTHITIRGDIVAQQ